MAYNPNYNSEYTGNNEEKTAKINAAALINSTIENLWRECYSAMASGDLVKWNRKLDAIWLTLAGDVKERSKEDNRMKEINLKIAGNGSLNHKSEGFGKLNTQAAQKISLQYEWLKLKSEFLRRLQFSQGKGTAYVDDEDEDLE